MAIADDKLLQLLPWDKVFMSRCYRGHKEFASDVADVEIRNYFVMSIRNNLSLGYSFLFLQWVVVLPGSYLTSPEEMGSGQRYRREPAAEDNKRGSLVRSKRNRNPVRKSGLVVRRVAKRLVY